MTVIDRVTALEAQNQALRAALVAIVDLTDFHNPRCQCGSLAAVKAMPPAKRQIVHASAPLGRYIPVL